MPNTAIKKSFVGRLSSLMEEINGSTEKQATEMGLSGDGKADPGGYQGASSHPSARAASAVQKAPLGFRAKENEADVKHDHPGAGVDNVKPNAGGSAEEDQHQIGTHKSETGDDPKVEDAYKGKKDDKREGERGGTEGPFNAEDVGEKYSSMHVDELTKLAYSKMNDVLSDIGNGTHLKEAMAPKQAAQAPVADPNLAAKAGYELSDLVGKLPSGAAEKQAAAQAVIEQTILDARLNADLVGSFLTKYATDLQESERLLAKQADGAGAMGGAMEGGGPPEMGGGAPPQMPPEAMGGGPPGGGGGPPGAGGAPGEEQIDEIINALLSMGATPEEIMQALQQDAGGAGGGAGGAPPGAGGPPEAAGAMAGMPGGGGGPDAGGKIASAQEPNEKQVLFEVVKIASDRFRNGQWQQKPVKQGTKEAQERLDLQRYIIEVCNAK